MIEVCEVYVDKVERRQVWSGWERVGSHRV